MGDEKQPGGLRRENGSGKLIFKSLLCSLSSHPLMVLFCQIVARFFALTAGTHAITPTMSISFFVFYSLQVRFSPNLDSYGWLVSGGQSGLVRIHFVRGLTSPLGHRMQLESRAHFNAVFQSSSPTKGPGFSSTSHRLLPHP